MALGAVLIEKHFTLDKDMEGWDHKISATPCEMKELVENSNRVFEALGRYRISAPETDEKKQEFRRSIVITRAMKAGEVIKSVDVDYKRPGSGIKPEMTSMIVGRTLRCNVEDDHILNLDDLV